MVRFGVAIPPVVARIFSGDSTSPLTEARTWCGARDGCGFERVVGMERFGAAIPPVVARIFSGDSTSPLTREARMLV